MRLRGIYLGDAAYVAAVGYRAMATLDDVVDCSINSYADFAVKLIELFTHIDDDAEIEVEQ